MNKRLIVLVILILIVIAGCSNSKKPIVKEEKKCSDGTKLASCSVNKPKYCFSNGVVLDKCDLCGCPNGLDCKSDGSCGSIEVIPEDDNLQEALDQLDLVDNL
ncbi:hypothetical protein HYX19_03985 [Candidatus Woesearchaeota archaeon]|nr:hypothetical protein [Candidatus Woesearchaeota archaeon]